MDGNHRLSDFALGEDRCGCDGGGQSAHRATADRRRVAEVPGGAVLADAVDAAERRPAAGA